MSIRTVAFGATLVLLVSIGAWLAVRDDAPIAEPTRAPAHLHGATSQSDLDDRVYYTCPMHPQVEQDAPGTCPICGMKLVERTRAASGAATRPSAVVQIDPRMAQNLGMRTAEVTSGMVARRIRAAGSIVLNEHGVVAVETRASGWVERLHVRAVGDSVQAGEVLAEINAPELRTALGEHALAEQLGDDVLAGAARNRLELLGAGDPNVVAKGRVTVVAPQSGVVTELVVREGAQIVPGMPLMKIADLGSVWIVVQVPEANGATLVVGAETSAQVNGLPGQTFSGTVDYIYPLLDTQTRTVRARIVVANPDGLLRPGMFADVTVSGPTETATLVPSEAVIRTGTRSVVIVAEEAGRYRPKDVSLGREHDDQIVVLAGLIPGERAVVSGQFLIDSEASLSGFYRRTADDSPAAQMRLMGEEDGRAVYGAKAGEEQ